MTPQRKTPADLTAQERAAKWLAIQRAATGQEPRNRQERRALERAERREAARQASTHG